MMILGDGVWSGMSVVIGVCGNNFCTFAADTRRVVNQGGKYVVADENTQKIFKLNDRILFGVTGLFNIDEPITSAITGIKNVHTASMQDVLESVLEYLDKEKYDIPPRRNYLIGGKTEDEQFGIYDVHMNFETHKPEVGLKISKACEGSPRSLFGISMSLPSRVAADADAYCDRLGDGILRCTTHDDLIREIGKIIYDISTKDESVNTNMMTVTVL